MNDSPGFYEVLAPPELGSEAVDIPSEGFAEHINQEVVVLNPDGRRARAKEPRIPVAGRARRGMAKFFDMIVVTLGYGATMIWWGKGIAQSDQTMFFVLAFTVGLAVAWGVWFVYNFFALWWFGTTLGKAMLGMRVCRLNGERLGLLGAIARTVAESFSVGFLGIGYLMAALDPVKKRAMHDHFCGTVVVMRER